MMGTPYDFDWNQARAFLVTAQEGSLSAAARKLGLTQPTLSRQVAALESELGVLLFERVGKQLRMTETGRALLDHVTAMGEAAGRVSLGASGRSEAIVGRVALTASDGVATYLLPRILSALRQQHPLISIDLVVSNELRDLKRREADIAIRHVRPSQPDLVAKKVHDSPIRLYAARSWLEQHGTPQTVEEVQKCEFIGTENNVRMVEVLEGIGLRLSLDNFKLSTNSGACAWELVRQGLGIGIMMEEIGELAADVEPILVGQLPFSAPLWLCTHRELNTSRRIRLVFDFLADALRRSPRPA